MNTTKIAALTVALALSATTVQAQDHIVAVISLPVKNQVAMTSLDADATAAIREAVTLQDGRVVEYGGVLYKDSTGYHYTQPVSNGGHEDTVVRAAIPKATTLVGTYHTHPKMNKDKFGNFTSLIDEDDSIYFSPVDIATAKSMKLPMYVGTLKRNMVIRFVPGKTKTTSMEDVASHTYNVFSHGDDVATIDEVL